MFRQGPDTDGAKEGQNASQPASQATVAPTEENYKESLRYRSLDEQRLRIVSFSLNGDEYAIEVADAVEVLKPRRLTVLPRVPEFIKGILSVRGEMVPVIDLKKRLGIASGEEKFSGRILITAVEDLKAGLIVERLFGVKDIPLKSVKPANAAKGALPVIFLKAVIQTDSGIINLLNINKLIDFTGA